MAEKPATANCDGEPEVSEQFGDAVATGGGR